MLHIHTYDLDFASKAVRQVYCPHRLTLLPGTRKVETQLDMSGPKEWPIVRLRYGAPVNVDAGDFPELFLIVRCLSGTGTMRQAHRSNAWYPGKTIPLSANLDTQLSFHKDFSKIAIKPNKLKLELLCSRWLGHPLDEDLRFDLSQFSDIMEHAWTGTLNLIESYGDLVHALPPAAIASLEEYVLTLLLKGHRHNYSVELETPDRGPHSRLVRRAEHYMMENAERPITISDVAVALNSSVRALQLKFRDEHDITPAMYFRKIRLELAHLALIDADATCSVTDVALRFGFLHLGRFAIHYKSRYGESPMATLVHRRAHRRKS